MIKLLLILALLLAACPGKVPPVNPVPDTDARLSWQAPTTNADGTELTDLSHYTVFWATSPDEYERLIDTIETDITIEGLDPLTAYFFMVTAVDEAGNESEPSNQVTWEGE